MERYGHSGLVETLPELYQGRSAHGCGSYIKDGKKVFQSFLISFKVVDIKKYLVVGGYDDNNNNYLSSTETWSPGDSSWTSVSKLPRTVGWAEAVSYGNQIYLIGKLISLIIIITLNINNICVRRELL